MSLFKRIREPRDSRTTVNEILMNVTDIRFFLDGHNIFQDLKGTVHGLKFKPDGSLEVHATTAFNKEESC